MREHLRNPNISWFRPLNQNLRIWKLQNCFFDLQNPFSFLAPNLNFHEFLPRFGNISGNSFLFKFFIQNNLVAKIDLLNLKVLSKKLNERSRKLSCSLSFPLIIFPALRSYESYLSASSGFWGLKTRFVLLNKWVFRLSGLEERGISINASISISDDAVPSNKNFINIKKSLKNLNLKIYCTGACSWAVQEKKIVKR